MGEKILIIEDEIPIADLLQFSLQQEGYDVNIAYDGKEGLYKLRNFIPNLLILDLMLPDMDGFDICKFAAHNYNIPIIIITAKSDIIDKILGLELGADDYITKPFDIREIITRVKVIFRRIRNVSNNRADYGRENSININENIKLYIVKHNVTLNGENIKLTPKEYKLLAVLAQNKGRLFTREQLLKEVWGYDYGGDTRTVDIHIQRLRKKLNLDKDNSVIETIFGFGYKMISR